MNSDEISVSAVDNPSIPRDVIALLITCGVVGFAAGVCGIAPAVAAVEIVRRLLSGDTDVAVIVIVAVVALAVRVLAFLGAGIAAHLADIRLGFAIRRALLGRIARVPLQWFRSGRSGDVKKAVEDDVAALHHLIAHATVDIPMAVGGPLAALVYLVAVDYRAALLALIPLVLGAICYRQAMSGSEEQYTRFETWLGSLNSAIVEYVHGAPVVRVFARNRRAHRSFSDTVTGFGEFYGRWSASTGRAAALSEVAVSPLSMLAVVTVGTVALVRFGGLALADVVAALAMSVAATGGIAAVLLSLHQVHNAREAADRIRGLLREPVLPETAEPTNPRDNSIELDAVTVAFDGNVVLEDVSLTMRPGTVTALVGPSGAGKSTLATLVPRFFDPVAGAVRVGGVDVRDIASARLYRHVAFVFQDSYLFRTSIADNIALADPRASPQRIREVAEAAQILDRIDSMPRGMDSVVGQDVTLSGGEAQRLCIARALLADAPILVLDEATAAADPENEARIQKAVSALARDRTVVVIAHRLATVAGADQIVVLDGGRIVERGTHRELLEMRGEYHRQWESDRPAERAS